MKKLGSRHNANRRQDGGLRQPDPDYALKGNFLTTCYQKILVSGVSVQDLADRLPDTRNLTPK